MVDETDLREQLTDAFDGAEYPVSSPMELVPALPAGPGTTFESGEFSMTAMELNAELSGGEDFPYETADELVDDVIAELKSNGHL
ncbi:MTH865 family protein [Natrialbaceae archaeon AArc-T1-2]|uniref:MTH865 family protein n=1 Tax=Natrialbaceae archaeon AArc-T1-2 TaxID=3053904 RepID=UPI00255ACF61|nr:MTH865 family protein [Natrialbaceae archaeon AArc-T1-2]WIV67572.1 MTH865 family protein [Natrialbaceae archaeon AArc-T1-2]